MTDLRRRVVVGSRRLLVTTVFEAALTLGVMTAVARQPGILAGPLAAIAWGVATAHCAIIWGFTIWNRRGIWRPLVEDTEAFLALLVVRARRRQVAARFTVGVVVTEAVVGVLAIAVWSDAGLAGWPWQHPTLSGGLLLFAVAAVGYAVRAARDAQRQLAWLRHVSREQA